MQSAPIHWHLQCKSYRCKTFFPLSLKNPPLNRSVLCLSAISPFLQKFQVPWQSRQWNDSHNKTKKQYEIEEVKYHKDMVLIKFKGIDKIEEAELLRNSYLKVNRKDEPELEEGTYYIVDLLGLDVYSDAGKLLGKLDDIFNNGSCDIYAVKDKLGKQLLLPAISDVIKEINLEQKKIVVHILKGLI